MCNIISFPLLSDIKNEKSSDVVIFRKVFGTTKNGKILNSIITQREHKKDQFVLYKYRDNIYIRKILINNLIYQLNNFFISFDLNLLLYISLFLKYLLICV
jgi:hypothetical protein